MRSHGVVVAIAVIALIFIAAVFSFFNTSRTLEQSVMGTTGLRQWLAGNDFDIVVSNPGIRHNRGDFTLRILPLYDTNLDRIDKINRPGTEQQRKHNDRNPLELTKHQYWRKVEALPTLVVLPKWDYGFAQSQIAHEGLLIPQDVYPELVSELTHSDISTPIVQRANLMHTGKATANRSLQLGLFYPQLLQTENLPPNCEPLVEGEFGSLSGTLLAQCDTGADLYHSGHVYLLSDPDLINNHGLSLAQNSSHVIPFIQDLQNEIDIRSDKQSIYLDIDPDVSLRTSGNQEQFADQRRDYERDSSSLAKMFAPPLSYLWAAAFILLAIVIWRGLKRFGPPVTQNPNYIEISKTAAIDAKARILRQSGNDGHMVVDFVNRQMQDLIIARFGAPASANPAKFTERYFSALKHQNAALAEQFSVTSSKIINHGVDMPLPELHHLLEQFRDQLESIKNGS